MERFRIRGSVLVSQRQRSRVFHCTTDAGMLAVKICLEETTNVPDPATAALDYTSLQQLTAQVRSSGEAPLCPAPVGLVEEHGTLAMTWETGVEMTELLLSPNTNARTGLELGKAAGDWLRRFHRLGQRTETSNDLPDKIPIHEDAIARLPRCPRIFIDSLHTLETTARRAGMIQLPVSWALGDFKSDNLLVDGGHAVAIDVQLRDMNLIIYNITQFLVHLELLRWSPRGLIKRPALEAAARGFLQTYGADVDDWHLPITWLRTSMLLQRGINAAATAGFRGYVSQLIALRALARSHSDLKRFL